MNVRRGIAWAALATTTALALSACSSANAAPPAPTADNLRSAATTAIGDLQRLDWTAFATDTGCTSQAAMGALLAAPGSPLGKIGQAALAGVTVTAATLTGVNGTTTTSEGKSQQWAWTAAKGWQLTPAACDSSTN